MTGKPEEVNEVILTANGILSESESTINKKLLGLISIIYLSTQINPILQRYIPQHFYRGEPGICLIMGIIAGCICQNLLAQEEVINLLYSQSVLFKLMLIPPAFYDLAFNVDHSKPKSLHNSGIGLLTTLTTSLFISLIYFASGMLDLSLLECMCLSMSVLLIDSE